MFTSYGSILFCPFCSFTTMIFHLAISLECFKQSDNKTVLFAFFIRVIFDPTQNSTCCYWNFVKKVWTIPAWLMPIAISMFTLLKLVSFQLHCFFVFFAHFNVLLFHARGYMTDSLLKPSPTLLYSRAETKSN